MPVQGRALTATSVTNPEQTLLYRIIEQHYPAFTRYVQREFEDYLKCGRLEHGFLRLRCDTCHAERLVAFGVAFAPAVGRDAWRKACSGGAIPVDTASKRKLTAFR